MDAPTRRVRAILLDGAREARALPDPWAEIPMPDVASACQVCGVTAADIDAARVIVSPSRVAHYPDDTDHSRCGHDATGTGWWWPL